MYLINLILICFLFKNAASVFNMSLQMTPCYRDNPESRYCDVMTGSYVKFTCSLTDIFDIRLEWQYISELQNTYVSVDQNSSKIVSKATPCLASPGLYNHTSTLTIWSNLVSDHSNIYCLSMLQDEIKTKSAIFIGFKLLPVVPSSVVQNSQFSMECSHYSLRLPPRIALIRELRLETFSHSGQVEVIAVNTPNTSTCSLRHPRFLNSLVQFKPDGQLFSPGHCVPHQNATRENMIIIINVRDPAARCSDSGAYRCTFQTHEGETFSSPPSILTVIAKPTIQSFKKSKCREFQIPPCQSVTLKCVVFGPKETVIKYISPSGKSDGTQILFQITKASKEPMVEYSGHCERYRHQATTVVPWSTNLSLPACNAFIGNTMYATMKSELGEIQMIDKPVVVMRDSFTITCEGAWFDVPPSQVLKLSVTALTERRSTVATYVSTDHPPLSKLHDRFLEWSANVVMNVYKPNIVLKIIGQNAQCRDSGWYECEIVDKSNVSYVQTAHILVNESNHMMKLNVFNCVNDTQCTIEEGEEFNVFCSVKALSGSRMNWIYNNSDQFSHTINVSYKSSQPDGPRDYCTKYWQTSKLNVKYARQHMTGWFECRVELAEENLATARIYIRIRSSGNRILDKTHLTTGGSFQIVCSTDMFDVPSRHLDYMKISILAMEENVVATYSPSKEIPLAYSVPRERHWTLSVLNEGEMLTIYVKVYNATCADNGLYQCSVLTSTSNRMVRLEELVIDHTEKLLKPKLIVTSSRHGINESIIEGETFHVWCSAHGPLTTQLKITTKSSFCTKSYRTIYNVDQMTPRNLYCPLYHHETVMTVFMASVEGLNVFQCDYFIGDNQLYRKVVNVSVLPDPVAYMMIDRTSAESKRQRLQFNCSSLFFGINLTDLLSLEVYRSSSPETSLASYRRNETIIINGIAQNFFSNLPSNWNLETDRSSDAISFNLSGTRPTCQDSGWYKCVACGSSGGAENCQAVRVDVDVQGDPLPMYQNEIEVLECEGKDDCVLDEGSRFNVQCKTIGHNDAKILWTASQEMHYNVSRSVRTAKYTHHTQCEIFDYTSRVTADLITPKLLTRFTCRFYRGDNLISTEYADIYVNTESNKILSKKDVVDGASFVITCSTEMFGVVPSDVDVLEISRESKPKAIIASHIRNLKQPLEFHKPPSRNWDIKVNTTHVTNHLTVTVTVVESKCSDSGWYQCSVQLTENDHVMKHRGHVRVTAKEAYLFVDVLQCRKKPVCSILAKETVDVICHAVGPVNSKIHWYFENSTGLHPISEMTGPVNTTDKIVGKDVQVEYCETRYRYLSTLTVYKSTVSRWFVCQLWTNQSNVVSRQIFVTVRDTSKGHFLASGNRIFFFAPAIFFVMLVISVAGYLVWRQTTILSPIRNMPVNSRRMALKELHPETVTSQQDVTVEISSLKSTSV